MKMDGRVDRLRYRWLRSTDCLQSVKCEGTIETGGVTTCELSLSLATATSFERGFGNIIWKFRNMHDRLLL